MFPSYFRFSKLSDDNSVKTGGQCSVCNIKCEGTLLTAAVQELQ